MVKMCEAMGLNIRFVDIKTPVIRKESQIISIKRADESVTDVSIGLCESNSNTIYVSREHKEELIREGLNLADQGQLIILNLSPKVEIEGKAMVFDSFLVKAGQETSYSDFVKQESEWHKFLFKVSQYGEELKQAQLERWKALNTFSIVFAPERQVYHNEFSDKILVVGESHRDEFEQDMCALFGDKKARKLVDEYPCKVRPRYLMADIDNVLTGQTFFDIIHRKYMSYARDFALQQKNLSRNTSTIKPIIRLVQSSKVASM